MSLGELLKSYLNGERTAINTIRILSGMFDPDQAINLLSIICSITRVEEGDLDKETFKSIFKLGE